MAIKEKTWKNGVIINLTPKEIAPFINIAVRDLGKCRYRLHKKLEIVSDTNLNDYEINF